MLQSSTRYSGKTVIVTGAGSGIGAATARRFAAEGANVVLVGRTREKLEQIAADLPAAHRLVAPCDVSDSAAVKAMAGIVRKQFGQIDVLVNNAGVAADTRIPEASDQQWRHVMSINLDGVFHTCREVIPDLIRTKGSVINVSSVSGLGGDWNMGIYNAAKGAVTNLTRSLAMDHGADGVRVNAVCPSLTRSELTADMFDNEALMAKFRERIPLGRAAEPEEIADVIAFLASEDARFITGVNLPVDGGLSASNGQPPQ